MNDVIPREAGWVCGCDRHFRTTTCPSTDISHGVLLHCFSCLDHNFSHSAWHGGEIVFWRNVREGAYEGMGEILAMARGLERILDNEGQPDHR